MSGLFVTSVHRGTDQRSLSYGPILSFICYLHFHISSAWMSLWMGQRDSMSWGGELEEVVAVAMEGRKENEDGERWMKGREEGNEDREIWMKGRKGGRIDDE